MKLTKLLNSKFYIAILWFVFAVRSYFSSHKTGYKSSSIISEGGSIIELNITPWNSVFISWLVITFICAGLYFVTKLSKNTPSSVPVYATVILFCYGVIIPSDVVGVHYALTEFMVTVLLVSVAYWLYTVVRNKFN